MGTFQNLTGQQFERLTVISRNRMTTKQGAFWNCRCVCGKKLVVWAGSLKRGNTRSCGCLRDHVLLFMSRTHGQAGKTAEYRAWLNMKNRCLNPTCDKFSFYGGRGIKICQQWIDSFEQFFADMGPKPGPRYSLDRFPNNATGNYEPGNVRWATWKQQCENRRPRTDKRTRKPKPIGHAITRNADDTASTVLGRIIDKMIMRFS